MDELWGRGNVAMLKTLEAYRDQCLEAISAVDLTAVQSVVEELLSIRQSGSTVFIAGNGGSAATASHMATDLMLGSQLSDPPLRVISLSDNTSLITATGNDLSFERVFSRQLASMAREKDLLIVVSASGNSPNLVSCVQTAQDLNVGTVAFTGFDGGILSQMVDLSVHVPTLEGAYGPVEDVHLSLNHMITECLKGYSASEKQIS